jgi:hypothetical protein
MVAELRRSHRISGDFSALHLVSASNRRSASFLKKRSKKLFLIASGGRFKRANRVLPVTNKSFLVLFFKKELLSSFAS